MTRRECRRGPGAGGRSRAAVFECLEERLLLSGDLPGAMPSDSATALTTDLASLGDAPLAPDFVQESLASSPALVLGQQIVVPTIAAMPDRPVNYAYQDWKAVGQGFDSTVFDPAVSYQYPVFWWDSASVNGAGAGFGMPSYVGKPASGSGEGINTIAAVLGATLSGVDKHAQTLNDGHTYDFVMMASRYYNSTTGANMVLNGVNSVGEGSFWYAELPGILYYGLADKYYTQYAAGSAGRQRIDTVINGEAAKLHNVINVLAGGSSAATPNFNYQGFNYVTMQPFSGTHLEPEGAAGAVWLQYMAYRHTGNVTYLADAQQAMLFLESCSAAQNPLYEVALPFGTLAAARMNAELGTNYDVAKMVQWNFAGGGYARPNWGANTDAQWGNYGAAGLIGDINNYPFSMNTYDWAAALVPLVRYDPRYANAIGKWMLNLTNSARLFLKSGLPLDQQASGSWNDAPSNYYSYESVRKTYNGKTPYAMGDATGVLEFAYGSGHAGLLGGIVESTNVPEILKLDLLATDFFHDANAYPSYLLYNPYSAQKNVTLSVGTTPVDLYDTLSGAIVATNVTGAVTLSISALSSLSLVYVPHGTTLTDDGMRVTAGGVIVNYRSPERDRLYWNNASAGSGAWNSTAANWSDRDGLNSETWSSGRTAVFAGDAGTAPYSVSVSGAATIGGLWLQGGAVTLGGSALALTAPATIAAEGGSHLISNNLQGAYNVTKSGSGAVTLGGSNTNNGLTVLGGTLTASSAANLGSGTLALDGPGTLQLNASSSWSATNALAVNSDATLAVAGPGGVTLSGAFSGSGNLVLSGGSLTLNGANTHTGTTTVVNSGALTLGASTTSAGRIYVTTGTVSARSNSSADAVLGLNAPDDGVAVFLLSQSGDLMTRRVYYTGNSRATRIAGGSNTSGTVTFSNWFNDFGGTAYYTAAAGGTVSLLNIVDGSPAAVCKIGPGTVKVTAISANTGSPSYSGMTTIRNGTLLLAQNDYGTTALGTVFPNGAVNPYGTGGTLGFNAFSNAVQVGDSGTLAGDNLALLTNGAYFVGHDVNINAQNSAGTTTLGNAGSGSAYFAGNVALGRNVALTAGSGGVANFTGGLSGSGGVTVAGSGTVVLGGDNTYGGGTTVSSGVLRVSNASGSATGSGPVTVIGGTLAGGDIAGTAGFINGAVAVRGVGAALSPGESAAAIITFRNGLTLDGATLRVDVRGDAPGAGYDQVTVTSGDVRIENNAVLLLGDLSGFVPGANQEFLLINNTGSGATSGSFSGLPAGSMLTINGGYYRIYYNGGDGNDVVLRSASAVAGRHVFYNNSAYDGNDPAANASDDNAIALDKTALLPGGTATFVNYTSYVRGINGIIIDIGGLSAQLTAADFEFRTGNDNNPSAWALATAPTISIRWGEGALLPDGVTHADRVTLTWEDYYVLQNGNWILNPNGIGQKWLQVTVKANANTGLSQNDVFCFGNAIGESGDSATSAAVNIVDFGGARDNPHNAFNRAAITDPYDFDRDQFVNVVELGLVRDNGTNAFNDLNLITVPASPSPVDAGQDGATAEDAIAEAVGIAGPTPLLDSRYARLGAIFARGTFPASSPMATTTGTFSNVATADAAIAISNASQAATAEQTGTNAQEGNAVQRPNSPATAAQPAVARFAARDAALAATAQWTDGGTDDEIASTGWANGLAVMSSAKGRLRRR